MDDNNSTKFKNLFMEIRNSVQALGEWKLQGRAGKKVIKSFVSIIDKGLDDPRIKGKVSYPLSEIIVLTFFAVLGGAVTFQEIGRASCRERV